MQVLSQSVSFGQQQVFLLLFSKPHPFDRHPDLQSNSFEERQFPAAEMNFVRSRNVQQTEPFLLIAERDGCMMCDAFRISGLLSHGRRNPPAMDDIFRPVQLSVPILLLNGTQNGVAFSDR